MVLGFSIKTREESDGNWIEIVSFISENVEKCVPLKSEAYVGI